MCNTRRTREDVRISTEYMGQYGRCQKVKEWNEVWLDPGACEVEDLVQVQAHVVGREIADRAKI